VHCSSRLDHFEPVKLQGACTEDREGKLAITHDSHFPGTRLRTANAVDKPICHGIETCPSIAAQNRGPVWPNQRESSGRSAQRKSEVLQGSIHGQIEGEGTWSSLTFEQSRLVVDVP
jgi:hypothetical protein